MKKVLGFDISSSTIGYCLLEVDELTNTINFGYANYVKPIKKGTIIERIVDTRNKIQLIIDQVKPDYIGIEDIIQFMQGKSTAKTIIMLTTFNRMIGLLAYDYLQKSPELFSVMSIRHGLKINKDFPKKEQMPELVAKHLGIIFPYEHDKKGKIKIESFDKADGIAVALYYAFMLTGKIKRKIIKVKNPKVKKKSVARDLFIDAPASQLSLLYDELASVKIHS
jgi:Holliday junction resolvasome RuvABC endonuclease subunit